MVSFQFRRGAHGAVVNGDAGGLVGVCAALRGDGVELVGQGFACVDVAVLEDGSSVAEDEVHCTINVTVSVELPE